MALRISNEHRHEYTALVVALPGPFGHWRSIPVFVLNLTLWRPLLSNWYSYKASCARPG